MGQHGLAAIVAPLHRAHRSLRGLGRRQLVRAGVERDHGAWPEHRGVEHAHLPAAVLEQAGFIAGMATAVYAHQGVGDLVRIHEEDQVAGERPVRLGSLVNRGAQLEQQRAVGSGRAQLQRGDADHAGSHEVRIPEFADRRRDFVLRRRAHGKVQMAGGIEQQHRVVIVGTAKQLELFPQFRPSGGACRREQGLRDKSQFRQHGGIAALFVEPRLHAQALEPGERGQFVFVLADFAGAVGGQRGGPEPAGRGGDQQKQGKGAPAGEPAVGSVHGQGDHTPARTSPRPRGTGGIRLKCRTLAPAAGATIRRSEVQLACLDLEGVLIPEIWIEFAKRTNIPELSRTTRDEPDYDRLMQGRLALLEQHGLGLPDIQQVIAEMGPLPGAREFLDWLRERFQVVILSDTFYEFAMPLMRQLGYPALFCHKLEVDASGCVRGYTLRMPEQKRESVKAFKALNFKVIAAGDSYNDTTMLAEADAGILFRPPQNVIDEFPQFPVTRSYEEMAAAFEAASRRI